MYLGVVCYLVASILGIAQISGSNVIAGSQFLLFVMTLGLCAIYCLLVSRISERSKFALVILSGVGVLSAFNLMTSITRMTETFGTDPLLTTLDASASCLHMVAVVLLFVPASREWFRRTEIVR